MVAGVAVGLTARFRTVMSTCTSAVGMQGLPTTLVGAGTRVGILGSIGAGGTNATVTMTRDRFTVVLLAMTRARSL